MNRSSICADVELVRIPAGTGQCTAEHHRARRDDFRSPAGVPYVVMAHGFGATVDSGLSAFAQGLAEAGFGVLAFDYRGWGRSGGEPRQVVDVTAQLADYRAVLAAARTLPEADPSRLAVWGASLAGGHVFQLAAEDPTLAAAIAMTPAVDGRAALTHILRRDGAQALRILGPCVRDLVARTRGGRRVLIPIVGEPRSAAVVTAAGGFSQYSAIAGPTWTNKVAAASVLKLSRYRPGSLARQIQAPILVQIADRDATSPVEPIRAAARKAARAEVRHYPGDHFDVYPGRPCQRSALAHQVSFLSRHLRPDRAVADSLGRAAR